MLYHDPDPQDEVLDGYYLLLGSGKKTRQRGNVHADRVRRDRDGATIDSQPHLDTVSQFKIRDEC
jgi:hypothetical protein